MTYTDPIELPECANPKVPAPEIPYRHMIDVQIRFNDIDIFGHVNNSAYLAYMDLAKVDYMRVVTDSHVKPGGMASVIVNINCSFYSPAYFEEPLAVVTGVESISVHSYKVVQRIFNPSTGDVKCIAHTILAGFDPATATGIPLPPDLTARLRAFEHL